jgi:CspA family cold shock protein
MDGLGCSAVKPRDFVKSPGGTKLDNPNLAYGPKETRMPSGTIKRLVRDRGFGFIRDDGGQEWFFHRSSVEGNFDQLNEGQRVSFQEEPSAKGPRAGNVRSEAA